MANPRQLKWITSSDAKNDPADARKLARLARADAGLLQPVEHRTAEQQAELAVIRARDAILRARTLLINSARSIAKGFGLRLPKSITATFGKRAVDTLPEFLRTALAGLLDQIDALSRKIAGYDQQIGELAVQHPELARLESIPGVGRLTALTFVLTLGRAERFAHSRDVAGFVGLRPKQRQSGARDSTVGDLQKRRRVSAQAAGAVLASHFGALGSRLGAAAVGPGQERRRQEIHVASHRRGGAQVVGAAAPAVGEWGVL